jgi:hypothetical protein
MAATIGRLQSEGADRYMKANVRACTAFVAGCLISERRPLKIYDYAQSRTIHFSAIMIERSQVNVYVHDDNCHFSGTGSGNRFSLYHHGQRHYVALQLMGNSFAGYDSGTGSNFAGTVTGSTINVVDFGAGDYFKYSL